MSEDVFDSSEKPPDGFFKCVKISLKNLLKHYEINQPKINDAVMKSHKIVIHTLQFMKLYILDSYNRTGEIPKIDKQFINSTMKILCSEKPRGKPPKKEVKELKEKLTSFYKEHYESTCKEDNLDYTHINTVLDYLTIDILTMYENNIKLHYVE